MIRFRNIFIIFVFIFLLLNFLYDFKNIRNLFNTNQENIISSYIFPQKNINELELQISKIKKERNTLEAQKKLFEKSFKELFEEITYLGSVEEKLENLLIQMDPYQFDMHIKNKNSDLEYSFNSKEDQLIVFSEIFYPNGWTLKVDNKFKEILNINYILRGAYVKAGIHKLVFEFKQKLVKVGTNIRWLTLIVFISFLIGLLKFESSLNQRTK